MVSVAGSDDVWRLVIKAVNQRYVRWWVMQDAHRIVRDFEESVKKEELIPPGSPLDFVPKRSAA